MFLEFESGDQRSGLWMILIVLQNQQLVVLRTIFENFHAPFRTYFIFWQKKNWNCKPNSLSACFVFLTDNQTQGWEKLMHSYWCIQSWTNTLFMISLDRVSMMASCSLGRIMIRFSAEQMTLKTSKIKQMENRISRHQWYWLRTKMILKIIALCRMKMGRNGRVQKAFRFFLRLQKIASIRPKCLRRQCESRDEIETRPRQQRRHGLLRGVRFCKTVMPFWYFLLSIHFH